jgi:hypothetical protein
LPIANLYFFRNKNANFLPNMTLHIVSNPY